MQFLDAIGLAYFWEKIKYWANTSFFSNKGGEISPTSGLHYIIDGEQLTVSKSGEENKTIDIFTVDENGMEAIKIVRTGGTASQVLMADGSVKPLNAANGICGLDANGRIPLTQLGNLDTSLFKLVTSLPSSGESNKIYIVKDGSDANDVYQEYYYTNGAWEKIGTHTVKVDLTPYAKKTEAVINMDFRGVASDGSSTSNTSIRNLVYTLGDGRVKVADVPLAEPRTTGGRPYAGQNGFMRASDKAKLDGIADGANNYTLPTASASVLGGILIGYGTSGRNYAVLLDGSGKAYVNVPWTDTNTTYDLSPYAKTADVNKALAKKVDVVSGKGLSTEDFTAAYKSKLDRFDLSNLDDSATIYMDCILQDVKISKDTSSVSLTLIALSGDETEVAIQAATSSLAGVMSAADKTKLNGIATGATADSAIPTSVIDALN